MTSKKTQILYDSFSDKRKTKVVWRLAVLWLLCYNQQHVNNTSHTILLQFLTHKTKMPLDDYSLAAKAPLKLKGVADSGLKK